MKKGERERERESLEKRSNNTITHKLIQFCCYDNNCIVKNIYSLFPRSNNLKMFSRSSIRLSFNQIRCYATETAESSSATADNGKMENLLDKLASITNQSNNSSSKSTMTSKKKYNSQRQRKDSSKSFTGNNDRRRNDHRRNEQKRNDQRRGTSSNRSRPVQTVSHFDRFKHPKKSISSNSNSNSNSKENQLNSIGLSYADLQEARALFIRRKVNQPISSNYLKTADNLIYNFFNSRANHKSTIYDLNNDKFSNFKSKSNIYKVNELSKSELELSKDKLGYDTKSRILRALELLTIKRGFKLIDSVKQNVSYLPFNGLLYPYANTTLPNNLSRPKANLTNLSNISEIEISSTISSVVKGERPELKYNPNENFKTDQLKINAQVVVNGLNRNSQLQVDNIHKSMSNVMLGKEPVKALPQPIFAPMKIWYNLAYKGKTW